MAEGPVLCVRSFVSTPCLIVLPRMCLIQSLAPQSARLATNPTIFTHSYSKETESCFVSL